MGPCWSRWYYTLYSPAYSVLMTGKWTLQSPTSSTRLTGCDTTSRVGTKKAALKANPENFLGQFGMLPTLPQTIIKKAEEYLVKVLRPGSEAKNFLVCGQRFSTTPRVVLNKSSPKPAKDSFQNQTEVL